MALSDRPAERHRQVALLFTDRVGGTRCWDAPSPVAGWTARDVVRHLIEWLSGFLSAGAAIELASGPSVDQDPVAAWRVHRDAVQTLLDDPADRVLDNPHTGALPLDRAIDRFYTADVFMHTWDLAGPPARTTGWTPTSAGNSWPAWNRWKRSSAPPASSAPGSRCRATRTRRPSCWASSAGTPSGCRKNAGGDRDDADTSDPRGRSRP